MVMFALTVIITVKVFNFVILKIKNLEVIKILQNGWKWYKK